MSTSGPPNPEDRAERRVPDDAVGGSARADEAPAATERRNLWMWVSLGLAVVSVGLLVWGLNTKSDLDAAQDDAAHLRSEADTEGKAVYDDVARQLGSANEDLAATQEELEKAKKVAAAATAAAAVATAAAVKA